MLSAGKNFGRYEIRSKLGEGGMGEVYLAQDIKLDRKVALKILPPDVATDRSRMNRFVQEAKAASALNHPNIITIYEVDETDSGHFIATEFIDGETVRERLFRAPFTIREALDVAAQVAAALAAAHQAGIIHRDIKPENVMVRADGLVKVLDFGLAKLTPAGASDPEAATRISDTQPGMIMGTVAYMSPEQARGKTVDARTDVWSLGVLLYEMLSGRTPFRGETTSDTLANILHRQPDALNIGALPTDLATIVERMLAKELEARYPTIANVVSDLKSLQRRIEFDGELQQTTLRSSAEARTEIIASTETAADSASSRTHEGFWVAVLPFKYPGSNSDLAALAEGLSEDIVTGLSRFPHLRVIARSSTSRFAGASGDVRSVGKELGARYVLEGSLRQAGTMLRVTVQLLDAITGAHLWAETYNRDLQQSDIFTVQDDITDRVVATVADSYGVLVRSMAASIEEKPETELTASDWILRQYRYRQLLTPDEHARVRDGLERFVARDSKHAAPWACLAQLYVDEFVFKFNPRADALDRALAAARRSVDLDRSYQYGNQILAQVHFFRRDTSAFRTTAEQAMLLNPRDTDTMAMMGLMLVHVAEFERGANIVRRAMDLNPNHAGWFHFAIIWEHLNKGDYEKALARITRVNMPGLFWQPLTVASICGLLERPVEAAAAVQELRRLDPDFKEHVREYIEVWHYSSGLMDRILEGLSKAGVEIVSASAPSNASSLNALSSETRPDEGFWIAVLPFKVIGSVELETLAEGLSEEIVRGLSRFSYLRVIARSSTLRYASETSDARDIGRKLGARYLLEGSLRLVETTLRVALQLVDTSSGAHLWAEAYDRPFRPEDTFTLQDDLVPRIVSTVADQHGVLPHTMSESVRRRDPEQLTAYEAVLRCFRYYEGVTKTEHAVLRATLERAVKEAPSNADCWAMLAIMYCDEHKFGFNQMPNSLDRALAAAQRAVEISPTNPFAYEALSQTLFFRKEFGSFRNAAERAISLNPVDGATTAFMGMLIAFTGDWDHGCAIAERATQLNPHHPGWYSLATFYNAYRKRDYEEALKATLKFNMPSLFYNHSNLAAVYAQLGNQEAASKSLRDLLSLKPDFATTARDELSKWLQPEFVEHLIEGFRKAGIDINETHTSLTTLSPSAVSSQTRADEGFWVSVLPFKSTSSDPAITALAEGLSEDIITGLSRFSYLRVIARSSTLRYASESRDVRAIGSELGARYVMEGTLRQAGAKLRLAVQLVDATTGAHLWAETYDRQFQPDQIFTLQDDLVPRIVSTCGDQFGVLARSISDAVRGKVSNRLSPYEALMRGFGYRYRLNPEEHAEVRGLLEKAVQDAPVSPDCWAMLSWLYSHEFGYGFNPRPGSLDRALAAARRAVDLSPSNQLAYQTLAIALFFRKDKAACLSAAERALTLNPLDASNQAIFLITFMSDWERGCVLVRRAIELNPYVPGWYRIVLGLNEYRKSNYREAIAEAVKGNAIGRWADLLLAAAYGELGEGTAARDSVNNLIDGKANPLEAAREFLTRWFDEEFVEHVVAGLRKARLRPAGQEDLAIPLPATGTAAGAASSPSIAVLPFANLSNDPDNDYFCDGLAEELLNALSKVDELKVAARTSAFSFKGKNTNVGEIASALNVNSVLEGSVRKSGNRVRITTQLVNAADGYHLWSERYDREMKDIFDVQDEITIAVVEALKVKLLGEDQGAVLKRYTRNPEAHEYYLRGLFYFNMFTPDDFRKAIDNYSRAVAIDPRYASAYAGLADAFTEMSFFSFSGEWMPKAREAANKALELDDTLAEAHNSLAIIKMYFDWDYAGAELEFKRALTLNPRGALIHMWYGWYLGLMGRFDESFNELDCAQELDPLSANINTGTGIVFHWSRQAERAIEQFRKVLDLTPNYLIALNFLAEAYEQKGDFVSAIATLGNVPQADPLTLSTLGYLYAKSGDHKKALEILKDFEQRSNQKYIPALNFAQIYAGLGDTEQVLEWLEKAFDERAVWMPFLKVDRKFDSLRLDPRFQTLLKRVGFS